MKKAKFLIIGSGKSKNNQDLLGEIKEQGHSGKVIPPDELLLSFKGSSNNFNVSHGRLDLDDHDIFIFRGYNVNRVEAQTLAERMLFLGKVVMDEIIGKNFIVGKMYAASEFSENKIDHISTFEAMNFATAKKVIQRMRTPFLVKANDSRQGRDLYKFTSKEKALDFLRNNLGGYLIQEYVPIQYDYRVMVVGGKALGAMKRYVSATDFRTNLAGTKAEMVPLNKELAKIAVCATKAMNYDIAGVDILEQGGKFRIIEVNIAPEWQKFKEITGINPAQEIVKVAVKRFRRRGLINMFRRCF